VPLIVISLFISYSSDLSLNIQDGTASLPKVLLVASINDESLEWLKFDGFGELIKFTKLSFANLLCMRPQERMYFVAILNPNVQTVKQIGIYILTW